MNPTILFHSFLKEKERDAQKLSGSTLWGQMINCLIQFALAEKTYASLMFLTQKWFGRKDVSLIQLYTNCYTFACSVG